MDRHLDENNKNLKINKFAVIYYYLSSNTVIASNLFTVSKFIPGLNILMIPLTINRDFAHAGLIILWENKGVFYSQNLKKNRI